jgi:hypothetical protein
VETRACDRAASGIGFVQRELDRIQTAIALRDKYSPKRDARLRAASQALSWALEPVGFASPWEVIMGTHPEQEDCSASPHLPV